jgi:hypothetical protein
MYIYAMYRVVIVVSEGAENVHLGCDELRIGCYFEAGL